MTGQQTYSTTYQVDAYAESEREAKIGALLVYIGLGTVALKRGRTPAVRRLAYAVALAIHEGATKISCFGMDFTYPDVHDAEKGRACVEFWMGVAAARGIALRSAARPAP